VLATSFNNLGLSGLAIEHNHAVRILLPKLSLIWQIALKRTENQEKKGDSDISTTYCFQDDNYERPNVAGHRSYASDGLKENIGCRNDQDCSSPGRQHRSPSLTSSNMNFDNPVIKCNTTCRQKFNLQKIVVANGLNGFVIAGIIASKIG
jgi:hypothetical protein